jgi:hypothetical protein
MDEEAHKFWSRSAVGKRATIGLVPGAIVTPLVLVVGVRLLGGDLASQGIMRMLAFGLLAGIILGASGGSAGGVLRGTIAGTVIGLFLLIISAVSQPATGLCGELRNFDVGSWQGVIHAALFGMVIGALGGASGGAVVVMLQ